VSRSGTGDRLLEVGDGVANQLRHAEGEHGEVGAAQMQHGRTHHHRDCGGDQRAEGDGLEPARALQHQRAGIGTDAEEG
jgi:hypothetical protein